MVINNLSYLHLWEITIPKLILPSTLEIEYRENNLKYHIPNINLALLKRNIVYQGPRIWNSLKNDIKIKESIFSFKKALKNELLVVTVL